MLLLRWLRSERRTALSLDPVKVRFTEVLNPETLISARSGVAYREAQIERANIVGQVEILIVDRFARHRK